MDKQRKTFWVSSDLSARLAELPGGMKAILYEQLASLLADFYEKEGLGGLTEILDGNVEIRRKDK